VRWAAILGVAVVLLVGGLVAAARSGHSGGNGSLTGSPSTGGVSNGGNGSGAQNGGNGGTGGGSGGPGGSAGSSGGGSGGGGGASPGASPGTSKAGQATAAPYTMPPAGDNIAAVADLQTSTCPGGYPPGYTCKVYVHGRYYLYSHPAGQLIVETVVDGKVAYSQTYQAPAGPHAFGSLMQFSVQKGAKEVDFIAILEDLTGNTLAKSKPIVTYAS
jgi:hypothetical protein